MIHCSTATVIATGTMTSNPANSHLRRASIGFLGIGF
jgi:hypothetical protein